MSPLIARRNIGRMTCRSSTLTSHLPLACRQYGATRPDVIVLHGGPAAPGCAGPLARGLAEHFDVLEPFQRGSAQGPVNVRRHIDDLEALLGCIAGKAGDGFRPALVGHSWGAQLALAFAAAHPYRVGSVAAVCSGTFDTAARAEFIRLRRDRTTDEHRRRLDLLDKEDLPAAVRFQRRHEITCSIYEYDPIETRPDARDDFGPLDLAAHEQTWNDFVRLQDDGTYPAAFRSITCPVLMLHGAYDPHPGAVIRDGLLPHIPHMQYLEFSRCGHNPWNERHAREEFFTVLRRWMAMNTYLGNRNTE